MNLSKLVAELINIRDELDNKVISINTKLKTDTLGNILETYKLELEYQRRRKYDGIDPIDFLEASALLNENDAKMIRESDALLEQIRKNLK